MNLTSEQIKKLPRINMSVDQFMKHIGRFDSSLFLRVSRSYIQGLPHGEFLGVWKQKSGKMVRIHLKKIWIRPYSMLYQTTGKKRKGKEILISNFKLPKGPIVI